MSNTKIQRFQHAFTLIEVMIVIALMAIVTTIVLLSVSSQKTNRDLTAASHELVNAIRLAQNNALTGKASGIGGNACAYGVQFVPQFDAKKYVLLQINKNASGFCNGDLAANLIPLSTYVLPNGVVFDSRMSVESGAAFALPRGEALWNGGRSQYGPMGSVNRIYLKKNGSFFTICFYPSGRTEEMASAGACPP